MGHENGAYYFISTHSLTKRLTTSKVDVDKLKNISTHSLTKRLTYISLDAKVAEYISTHSLTKRLTALEHLTI